MGADGVVWIDKDADLDDVQGLTFLVDLIRSRTASSWRIHAACIGVDTNAVFFGERQTNPEAIELCRSCPVVDDCREWALSLPGTPHGFLGGMSARQRIRERRRRERRAAA